MSPYFNTFNKIFIHLNMRALLMYKTKEMFNERPHDPWIVIPVDEIQEVKMISLKQTLPQHIWDGIEEQSSPVDEEQKERLAVEITLKQQYKHIRSKIMDLPKGLEVSKKASKNKQLKPS